MNGSRKEYINTWYRLGILRNKLYTSEKGLHQIQLLNQLLDLKAAPLFIGYENPEQFIQFSKPQFVYL